MKIGEYITMPRNLNADFDISNENYIIFSSDEDDQSTETYFIAR